MTVQPNRDALKGVNTQVLTEQTKNRIFWIDDSLANSHNMNTTMYNKRKACLFSENPPFDRGLRQK